MYWFTLCTIIFLFISLVLNTIFIFRFAWTDPASRARRIMQNLSISLFSFLFIVLVLELFFKLIFAQSDTFGYTLAEQNWHDRYWRGNSLKYRDKEWTPEMLEGRTTIMVLGDSFVEGAGIKDPANRFPDLLNRMLGDDYAVMNVGKGGSSTKDEIQHAVAYPYRPDIVILAYYINDIEQTAVDMGFDRPQLRVDTPALVDYSYALNFFYWRVYRLGPQEWSDTYWAWLQGTYENPDIWSIYQSELLQIHYLAQKAGDQLIVVVFPELRAVEDSRPITARVVNLFREQGVPVLDVTDLVAGMDPADLVVNSVDSHPNEFVHRLVAEQLYPIVLDTQQATSQ